MTTTTATRPQSGPPLLAPAIAFGVFTVATAALGAGGTRPDSSAAQVNAYALAHSGLLDVLAFAVFGTAFPLAIWAAAVYRRQRRLGVTAPGAAIGFAGGMLAAASLAVSGLATWTAAQAADPAAPALSRALTSLAFASGGPGFVVPLALLIAGLAVPALFLKLLPRWVSVAGLVIAAAAVLATFSLLTPALYPLIPIGRFGGLLWLVLVSVLLPRDRHQLR